MIRKVAAIFALCIFIFSCSTQHVVSDHAIQKRKYRPGLFVSKKSKSIEKDQESVIAEQKEIKVFSSQENFAKKKASIDVLKTKTADHIVQEPKVETKNTRSFKSDPLAISNRIIEKLIPMQYAEGFTKQLGRLAAQETEDEGTSMSAIIGCSLGGTAVVCFIAGLATIDFGPGIFLMILAFAISIVGLIFSINAAIESGRSDIKGTALSIIGIISNGVIVIMGLIVALIAFIIIGIIASLN
ncbi:MAG: hypothetical protein ACI9RU_002619 [Litorivivens sp.]|jgi:hypothetical protein